MKVSEKKGKSIIDQRDKIIFKAVGLETFALLSVLPLFFHHYYFDILPAKYMFYYISVLVTLGIVLAVAGWAMVKRGTRMSKGLIGDIKNGLNAVDVAMLVLLCSMAVSTIFSEYVFESFWGNEGRLNGMYLWLVYAAAFFLISKKLRWNKRYLELFLVAGVLACLFGITDFFRLNILGFKTNMASSQLDIFMSTFGNINSYTAYVGMFLAVSVVLFIMDKDRRYMIWHYICVAIGIVALIMGQSDNGYLSMMVIWGLGPLYFFREKQGLRRYLITVATLFTSMWVVNRICVVFGDQVIQIEGLFKVIAGLSILPAVIAALWLCAAGLCFVPQLKGDGKLKKWPVYAWGIMLILVVAAIVFAAWDVNVAGNVERYGGLGYYLLFNEEWGTYRGLVWKISMENYFDFPLWQKLFGYGPDTFGIVTVNRNMREMISKVNMIFDSAHNEYIHYLFTIGIVGVACYLGYLVAAGWRMLRRGLENPYVMACLLAVVSYGAQAIVNIASPIITPIMMTLLAVGLAACRGE